MISVLTWAVDGKVRVRDNSGDDWQTGVVESLEDDEALVLVDGFETAYIHTFCEATIGDDTAGSARVSQKQDQNTQQEILGNAA